MNYNIIGSTVGIGILVFVAIPVIGMAAALAMLVVAALLTILFRYSKSGRQKDPIYDQEPVAFDPKWVQPEKRDPEELELAEALAAEEGWNRTRAYSLLTPNRYGDIPIQTYEEHHLTELHRLNYLLNKLAEKEGIDTTTADTIFSTAVSYFTVDYLEKNSQEHYNDWCVTCLRACAYLDQGISIQHTLRTILVVQGGDTEEMAFILHILNTPEEERDTELAKMELQNVRASHRTRDTVRLSQGVQIRN